MITSPGRRSVQLRQAAFFFVTIILPCGVIAVMAARMLVQERELIATRVADARRAVVSDARLALLGRTERLRVAISANSSPLLLPADVVLVAAVAGSDLALPWESSRRLDHQHDASASRFREAVARGEREEFAGNHLAAAASYQVLASTAAMPNQRAWAQLLTARAFTKAARPGDAHAAARLALQAPPDLADDQNIPFVVYAARMLAASAGTRRDDAAKIVVALRRAVASPNISPAAIYMIKDVVAGIAASGDLAEAVDARARGIEQILSLRAALPTLGIPEWSGDAEPTWTRFGAPDNSWLVSIQPFGRGRRLIAVRAAPLIASVQASWPVTISTSPEGDPLAPNFPGLRAVVSPTALAAVAADSSRQRPFYLGALVMVISVAIFGGVLFWRDVRRDIRVGELRAQFVSSVSHELKTPLTAIRMFAETLLMGRARPEVQHEYLETIVNESERLTRLLNNVLDFSSIEDGNKNYRLEPLSLASAVRAAAKAMEYPCAQQGFELRIAIDEDVPPVAADRDAIQQAVLNLLSNAVKYSGDGRIVARSADRDRRRAGLPADPGAEAGSDHSRPDAAPPQRL